MNSIGTCSVCYYTARPLRSSDLGLLAVPQPKLKSRGDLAFAVAAPQTVEQHPPLY